MTLILGIVVITLSIIQIVNMIIDRVFPQTQKVIIEENPELLASSEEKQKLDEKQKSDDNVINTRNDNVELEGAENTTNAVDETA